MLYIFVHNASKLFKSSTLRLITSQQRFHLRLEMAQNVISLQVQNDAKTFIASFTFHDNLFGFSKPFEFHRPMNELVDTFLVRVSSKISAEMLKRKDRILKRGGTLSDDMMARLREPVNVLLLKDDKPIDKNLCWSELLKDKVDNDSGMLRVVVANSTFLLEVNKPCVKFISLPDLIYSDMSVRPVKLVISYGTTEESDFRWFRDEARIPLATGFTYYPRVDDVGQRLMLQCTPCGSGENGRPVEVTSTEPVQLGPLCPFEERFPFTASSLSGDKIRVVTYNILADLYVSSRGAKDMFSYCPTEYLKLSYRTRLLEKELRGYNADIICLQEVDCRVYGNELQAIANELGMKPLFFKKGAKVNEGCAMLFSQSRFRLISQNGIVLSDDTVNGTYIEGIWNKINSDTFLKNKIMERTNSLQVVVLEHMEMKTKLIVGNTHLYYHPNFSYIRIIQAALCVGYLYDIREKLLNDDPRCKVSILYCGDFNCVPNTGAYKLIVDGSNTASYKPDKVQEAKHIEIVNPVKFFSACGIPEFTNFTTTFVDTLDYIFIQPEDFRVVQVLPFFSAEVVSAGTAIPSQFFPSDHISLVADLQWIDSNSGNPLEHQAAEEIDNCAITQYGDIAKENE